MKRKVCSSPSERFHELLSSPVRDKQVAVLKAESLRDQHISTLTGTLRLAPANRSCPSEWLQEIGLIHDDIPTYEADQYSRSTQRPSTASPRQACPETFAPPHGIRVEPEVKEQTGKPSYFVSAAGCRLLSRARLQDGSHYSRVRWTRAGSAILQLSYLAEVSRLNMWHRQVCRHGHICFTHLMHGLTYACFCWYLFANDPAASLEQHPCFGLSLPVLGLLRIVQPKTALPAAFNMQSSGLSTS